MMTACVMPSLHHKPSGSEISVAEHVDVGSGPADEPSGRADLAPGHADNAPRRANSR
jgi:hypothetical protein